MLRGRSKKKGKSQVSKLLDSQEQLKHELEKMSLLLVKKDTKIDQLKTWLAKGSQEGPGSKEALKLKEKKVVLTVKVGDLNDKLLKSHEEVDARLSLVL